MEKCRLHFSIAFVFGVDFRNLIRSLEHFTENGESNVLTIDSLACYIQDTAWSQVSTLLFPYKIFAFGVSENIVIDR